MSFKLWQLWLLGNGRWWCHGCFAQNSSCNKLLCLSICPLPCTGGRKWGCFMTWWENWSWWGYSALSLCAASDVGAGWAWFPGKNSFPEMSKTCSTSWDQSKVIVKLLCKKDTFFPQTNRWWCLSDDTCRHPWEAVSFGLLLNIFY